LLNQHSISMSNFLSQLTTSERARLFEELNYMNLEEIRGFCSERGIPYRIVAEHANGKKATKDTDRKPIVLARVRRYLTTGRVGSSGRRPVVSVMVRATRTRRHEVTLVAARKFAPVCTRGVL